MAGRKSGNTREKRRLAKSVRDSKAPAISRAAAIMRLLGKSDTALSLQSIAQALGLVPSTCLYTLRALVEEEFVAFDPDTKRYSLEAGVLSLARQWLRRNIFPELAQPYLDRISVESGVTTLGVQIVGLDHIIVVATATSPGNFQLSAEVGSRFPALISATGRCIAAFGNYPDDELEARFAGLRWDDAPSYPQWCEQVKQTRDRGFAVDPGNYIAGVTVFAAPVWNGGARPSHALVALGIGGVASGEGRAPLEAALLADSRALTERLGG